MYPLLLNLLSNVSKSQTKEKKFENSFLKFFSSFSPLFNLEMVKKAFLLLLICSLAFAEDVDPEVQALCDIKNTLNPYLWRDNIHSPCDMKKPCDYVFAGVVCDENNEHVIKLFVLCSFIF